MGSAKKKRKVGDVHKNGKKKKKKSKNEAEAEEYVEKELKRKEEKEAKKKAYALLDIDPAKTITLADNKHHHTLPVCV